MSGTLKGKYRPRNPEKYRGDAGNILYRSSWELNFMQWCDYKSDRVVWWQSEEKRIPYYDPIQKKRRIYYPDFFIGYKSSDDIVRDTLVEVKPVKQVKGPPQNPKRRTKRWVSEVQTYVTNRAKWQAAAEWCEDHGANFQLITEKELGLWQRSW